MIKVQIFSPEKIIYESDTATSIGLPGKKSPFTILPQHANLLTELLSGIIYIKTSNESQSQRFVVRSGFASVRNNVLLVGADEILTKEEVNLSEEESNLRQYETSRYYFDDSTLEKIEFIQFKIQLALAK